MPQKLIIRIAICVTVCLLISLFAAMATYSSVDTWYFSLKKPDFNPPNGVFSLILIIMNVLMGISAGIVWNRGFYHKWVKTALYHFVFQLILNTSWSILFFGLNLILPALLISITLFIVLLFTFKWFKVVEPAAAYLLIPYVLWIAYATYLNFEIWRLN
ncbi:MAG: TspO/MBR family protein [Leeuwenhoekiella sp.]